MVAAIRCSGSYVGYDALTSLGLSLVVPHVVPCVGVLMGLAADDPESQARLAAFAQGLQQSGWSIGQNLWIDYRWGGGDPENMRKYAADLVALAPDVILAHSSACRRQLC